MMGLNLTENEVKLLNDHNVQTDEDVLYCPMSFCYSKASHGFPASKLCSLQKVAEDKYFPEIVSMYDVMRGLDDGHTIFSTNDPRIDQLLNGGIQTGQITELVGSSAAGKTQLCMQIAAAVAKNPGDYRIAYIDTSQSFCAERLETFMNGLKNSEKHVCNAEALDRIEIYQVHTIDAVMEALQTIKDQLDDLVSMCSPFKLVIIDSLAAILAPIVGKNSVGHAMLISVVRMMKAIACQYVVAFVITNHTVSTGMNKTIKPALGETWMIAADTRLMFFPSENDRSPGHIMLVKSPNSEVGQALFYKITANKVIGLADVPVTK